MPFGLLISVLFFVFLNQNVFPGKMPDKDPLFLFVNSCFAPKGASASRVGQSQNQTESEISNSQVLWSNQGGPYGITDCYALEIEPAHGNFCIAGSLKGMVKSLDGGNSWLPIPGIHDGIYALAIHPQDTNRLYAGSGNFDNKKLFISTDGGSQWKAVATQTRVTELAISKSNPDKLIIASNSWGKIGLSQNGGSDWQYQDLNIARVYCLAFHPKDEMKIFVAGEGACFYSSDGGKQWQKLTNGLPSDPYAYFEELAFHPDNPDVILLAGYLGGNGFVYRSQDGGQTWHDVSSASFINLWSVNIAEFDHNIIFAGGLFSTLWKSTFDTFNWEIITDLGWSAEVVRTSKNKKLFMGSRYDGIYRSLDGGKTFAEVNQGATLADMRCVAFHPANKKIAVAAGWSGGIFRTENGGQTWTLVQPGGSWLDVDVCQSNPAIWFACGCDPNVMKSVDGGISWQLANNGFKGTYNYMLTIALNPQNQNQAIVLSHYGSDYCGYQTNDGGNSWTPIQAIPGVPYYTGEILFDPLDPRKIFISVDKGTIYSIDGGTSWAHSSSMPLKSLGAFITPAAGVENSISTTKTYGANGNKIYYFAATAKNEVHSIEKAWEVLFTVDRLQQIDFCKINANTPSQIVIIGKNASGSRCLYSGDNGKTWTDQSMGIEYADITDLAVDFSTSNRLLTTRGNSVYVWQSR